jgi:hypothetical protein
VVHFGIRGCLRAGLPEFLRQFRRVTSLSAFRPSSVITTRSPAALTSRLRSDFPQWCPVMRSHRHASRSGHARRKGSWTGGVVGGPYSQFLGNTPLMIIPPCNPPDGPGPNGAACGGTAGKLAVPMTWIPIWTCASIILILIGGVTRICPPIAP